MINSIRHDPSAVSYQPMALVTGATGAIGYTLVRYLLDMGYQVRVLARRAPLPGFFPKCVKVVVANINDSDALHKATAATDVVFHLAAKLHTNNPAQELHSEYERVNVEGTRRLVEAIQVNGVSCLVFFSTISVYGPSQPGIVLNENSPLLPQTFYAQTKCRAERIVLAARKKDSNEPLGVVLRLASVYGPRMKGNYARLVRALHGGWFQPLGSGLNLRTLVYDQDVASAALLAAEHPRAPGQVYNVTDGQIHTFNEILGAICQALGRRLPRYHLPATPFHRLAGYVEKGLSLIGKPSPMSRSLVEKLLEDVAVRGDKIQRELGFQPQFDLITGWRQAVPYLITNM